MTIHEWHCKDGADTVDINIATSARLAYTVDSSNLKYWYLLLDKRIQFEHIFADLPYIFTSVISN